MRGMMKKILLVLFLVVGVYALAAAQDRNKPPSVEERLRVIERRLDKIEKRVDEGHYRMDEIQADIREIRRAMAYADDERTEILMDLQIVPRAVRGPCRKD